jgi:formylglycine-generating enzyme required for sulfatase activity
MTPGRGLAFSMKKTICLAAATLFALVGLPCFADGTSSGARPDLVAIEMVAIPGGTLGIGADSPGKRVHTAAIRSFHMGKFEVTQGQWRSVLGSSPAHFPTGDNYPVESVSWDDCQAFIGKLNEMTGRHYRLPTEAEWEYACRAGTTGERYGSPAAIAWYDRNSGGSTHPVGEKQPNAFGLYDMLGNVWEWCQDWYSEDWYRDHPARDGPSRSSNGHSNPTRPGWGSLRVFRGGSWGDSASYLRASLRGSFDPGQRGNYLGFRLAADPEGN